MSTNLILVLILVVIILFIIFIYNNLVNKLNQTKEAWADIDVQFKRRFDLIPNLISTVKGAANFESGTLEKVIQARNMAMASHDASDINKIASSENILSGTLKSLFALSENYPALTATNNFKELQIELADTENKVQSARRFYNSNVKDLNTSIQVFPSNLFAKVFGFKEMELFNLSESEVEAKEPVKVSF